MNKAHLIKAKDFFAQAEEQIKIWLFDANLAMWEHFNEFGLERPRKCPVVGVFKSGINCAFDAYVYREGGIAYVYRMLVKKRSQYVDLSFIISDDLMVTESLRVGVNTGRALAEAILYDACKDFRSIQEIVEAAVLGSKSAEDALDGLQSRGLLTKSAVNKAWCDSKTEYRGISHKFSGTQGIDALQLASHAIRDNIWYKYAQTPSSAWANTKFKELMARVFAQ